MSSFENKSPESSNSIVTNEGSKEKSRGDLAFQFVDNRSEAVIQRRLQEMANNSPRGKEVTKFQEVLGSEAIQLKFNERATSLMDTVQRAVVQLNEVDLADSNQTGDDWYTSKTESNLSNTAKAKKKYQQLLYEFFNLTDESQLAEKVRNVNLTNFDGDFISSLVSLHKHIAPFEGKQGQGFDRDEQSSGNYSRSSLKHPLNILHKNLLELRGSIPGDWIQPVNRALLTLQSQTAGQENIEKLVPQESGANQEFDTSLGRFSSASAGLPKNNMNLLDEIQKIANSQNLPNTFFTKDTRGKGRPIKYGLVKNPIVSDENNDKVINGSAEAVQSNPEVGDVGQNKTIQIDGTNSELHVAGDKFTTKNTNFSVTGTAHAVKQEGNLRYLYVKGNVTGRMGNPQREDVGDHREASKNLLFDSSSEAGIYKSRNITNEINQAMQDLDGPRFQNLIASGYENGNPHDAFLADRAKIMNSIADKINTEGISGVKVIGSEDHPSLILYIPQNQIGGNDNYRIYYGNYFFDNKRSANTNAVLDLMVADFNDESEPWGIKLTKRGSFGFQHPTLTDTGDSVRFWPGYAPVESLTAGLNRIVSNILEGARAKAAAANEPDLPHNPDLNLSTIRTDFDTPLVHLEGLKSAMRQASVSLGMTPPANRSQNQIDVTDWLKIRLLVKLKQSETILKFGENLIEAKKGDKEFNQEEFNKNYLMAADMNNKLQEYSFMYTAGMIDSRTNPNEDVTKVGNFKKDDDVYEKHLKKELGNIRGDHKVFYLDSGEQALVAAGLLANRYKQQVDAQAVQVASSPYQNLDSYFEVGVFRGAERSNLERDGTGEIIHSDLSPVITSGDRKSQQTIIGDLKGKWQEGDGRITPGKNSMIPIIDVTNSSLGKVSSLGNMPDNYILVESLTKHQQIGADKFTMGRLVAVSSTNASTSGHLISGNFLDLAQQVVGPVANEAFNPVLNKLREQTDEVLYKKTDKNRFALILHPSLSSNDDHKEQLDPPVIDFTKLRLMIPLPSNSPRWLFSNSFNGANMWESILRNLKNESNPNKSMEE